MPKEWRIRPPASASTLHEIEAPPVVAQLLSNRGITSSAEIDSFLNPTLHSPDLLPGMEPACHRLSRALKSAETVAVYGDFDVDGVTGTALLAQGLCDLGARVLPYIPDRLQEGHGLNAAAVETLARSGATVLVTVDCGIDGYEEVCLAQELGMDVIITDHHIPPPSPPPAMALIDPKLESSRYPFPGLSGAGLALKLVQGLCDLIGKSWRRDLLELAALSTVADMVPLRDENRYLVREGLKELRNTQRPGLQAIYRKARIRPGSMDAETISFSVAPRLNAAGRLEHASSSYRLLTTQSSEEADALASELEALNRRRQELTKVAHSRALEIVNGWDDLPWILVVKDDLFSPGIAGLVASRLVDDFSRPAIVLSQVDGLIRASARSIPGFHLVEDGLSPCGDLFVRYGGHSGAAGFTMLPENLPQLAGTLDAAAEQVMCGLDLQPALDIDAEVPVSALRGETFRWIRNLEPFGIGNPRPTFLTRGLLPMDVRSIGVQGHHLKLKLKERGFVWDAIAFRQADRWDSKLQNLDVVYTMGTEWRGDTEILALNVLDFRASGC